MIPPDSAINSLDPWDGAHWRRDAHRERRKTAGSPVGRSGSAVQPQLVSQASAGFESWLESAIAPPITARASASAKTSFFTRRVQIQQPLQGSAKAAVSMIAVKAIVLPIMASASTSARTSFFIRFVQFNSRCRALRRLRFR